MSNGHLFEKVYPSIYQGYSILINGIFAENGFKTNIRKQNYLQQLQGPAKELWHSYRPMNRHVSVGLF